MTLDTEKSFKAKLRALAKEKNRDPADLWQGLVLERFLVRLAKSEYSKHFVLKGGILLSKYVEIGRETTDLDFLAQRMSNEVSKLKDIFEKVASIDLQDGFSFCNLKVRELAHPHMGYPGVKVSMIAHFVKTRFKVVIDIGFGDFVNPVKYMIPLTTFSRGDLFESSVIHKWIQKLVSAGVSLTRHLSPPASLNFLSLAASAPASLTQMAGASLAYSQLLNSFVYSLPCYPMEFIFAEKLETIIYRGVFNSRMKDFHDLHSMITSSNLSSFQNLETVISQVFEHRKTKLVLPIHFANEDLPQMQNYWKEYLKNLRLEHMSSLPESFIVVISEINDWLRSHTKLIYK